MKHNKHTILLAHGSRDMRWTQPFEDIASRAKENNEAISLAYMELASPDLSEAVGNAKRAGASSITVLPLFFAAGKHLREDVPATLHKLSQHLDVNIQLLPPIGEYADFQTAMVNAIDTLLNEKSE